MKCPEQNVSQPSESMHTIPNQMDLTLAGRLSGLNVVLCLFENDKPNSRGHKPGRDFMHLQTNSPGLHIFGADGPPN